MGSMKGSIPMSTLNLAHLLILKGLQGTFYVTVTLWEVWSLELLLYWLNEWTYTWYGEIYMVAFFFKSTKLWDDFLFYMCVVHSIPVKHNPYIPLVDRRMPRLCMQAGKKEWARPAGFLLLAPISFVTQSQALPCYVSREGGGKQSLFTAYLVFSSATPGIQPPVFEVVPCSDKEVDKQREMVC